MVQTNLLKRMLLGLVFLTVPVLLNSCDDDGGGGPSVEEGTVNAQVAGSENLDLSQGQTTFTQTTDENVQAGYKVTDASVTWQGASPRNQINLELTNVRASDIKTGEYKPINASPTQTNWISSKTSIMIDSNEYNFEGQGGSVEVTNKSDSDLIGKFNDLKFEERSGSDSVILNGAFHAQSN